MHFLILPSSLFRYSKEQKTKRIFQLLWLLFEIIQPIQFFHIEKHLDGAWDTFWLKSLNGTFTLQQKKAFGPIFFKFHAVFENVIFQKGPGWPCPVSASLKQ